MPKDVLNGLPKSAVPNSVNAMVGHAPGQQVALFILLVGFPSSCKPKGGFKKKKKILLNVLT